MPRRDVRAMSVRALWAGVLVAVTGSLQCCEHRGAAEIPKEVVAVGDPCDAPPSPDVGEGAIAADRRQGLRVLPLHREMCINGTQDTLVRVPALVPLEDNALAVVQWQSHDVRYFDAHGNPLGAVGSEGEGPGEFTGPSGAGLVGDSVWIYDDLQKRFTIIAPDRSVVRVSQVPLVKLPGATSPESLWLQAVLPDGAVLGIVSPRSPVGEGGSAPPNQLFVRATPRGQEGSGNRFDVLGTIPPRDAVSIALPHGGGLGARPPFPNDPLVAVSPDGSHVAIASAALDGSASGTISLVMMSAGGDTLYDRHLAFERIPIPPRVAQDALAGQRKLAADVKDPRMAGVLRQAARAPAIYPPIVDGVVSNDGRLFFRGTLKDRGYRVLNAHGTDMGWVRIPVYGKMMGAEGDQVWTVESDSLGIESIARYGVGYLGG